MPTKHGSPSRKKRISHTSHRGSQVMEAGRQQNSVTVKLVPSTSIYTCTPSSRQANTTPHKQQVLVLYKAWLRRQSLTHQLCFMSCFYTIHLVSGQGTSIVPGYTHTHNQKDKPDPQKSTPRPPLKKKPHIDDWRIRRETRLPKMKNHRLHIVCCPSLEENDCCSRQAETE